MKAETVSDPRVFLDRASDLLADEARHNLIRGVVGTLIRSPEVYPEYRMFLVSERDTVVAAAAITAPYNLIVADTSSDDGLAALAAAVAENGVDVPGIIGNTPTVGQFVTAWERIAGARTELQMAQGVFAIERVEPARPTTGSVRTGGPADQELIVRWMRDFLDEALPHEPTDKEKVSAAVARRLSGETPGAYWMWVAEERPVSLTGHGNPTGRGIRIGPVYTPPQWRGNGYASALVAAQSQWLLDNGYDFCFLFTDLANPTSNAIYERIGYRQVAEAASYGVEAS